MTAFSSATSAALSASLRAARATTVTANLLASWSSNRSMMLCGAVTLCKDSHPSQESAGTFTSPIMSRAERRRRRRNGRARRQLLPFRATRLSDPAMAPCERDPASLLILYPSVSCACVSREPCTWTLIPCLAYCVVRRMPPPPREDTRYPPPQHSSPYGAPPPYAAPSGYGPPPGHYAMSPHAPPPSDPMALQVSCCVSAPKPRHATADAAATPAAAG